MPLYTVETGDMKQIVSFPSDDYVLAHPDEALDAALGLGYEGDLGIIFSIEPQDEHGEDWPVFCDTIRQLKKLGKFQEAPKP